MANKKVILSHWLPHTGASDFCVTYENSFRGLEQTRNYWHRGLDGRSCSQPRTIHPSEYVLLEHFRIRLSFRYNR
jgi:hypothetical protein